MSINSFDSLLSENQKNEFMIKIVDECTLQQIIELCVGMEKEKNQLKKRNIYSKQESKYIQLEKTNPNDKKIQKRKLLFALSLWEKIKINQYSEWIQFFQLMAGGLGVLGGIAIEGYANNKKPDISLEDIWETFKTNYVDCIINICTAYDIDKSKGRLNILHLFPPLLLLSGSFRDAARIKDIQECINKIECATAYQILHHIIKELKQSSKEISSETIKEWLNNTTLFNNSPIVVDSSNRRLLKKFTRSISVNLVSTRNNFDAYCKQFKTKIVDLYKTQKKTNKNLILGGLASVGGMAISGYASYKLKKLSKKVEKRRKSQFLKTLKAVHTK